MIAALELAGFVLWSYRKWLRKIRRTYTHPHVPSSLRKASHG